MKSILPVGNWPRKHSALGLGHWALVIPLGAVLFLHCFSLPLASAESILLKNAIVHTVSGETYTNGGVLINDDKIEKVSDGKIQ